MYDMDLLFDAYAEGRECRDTSREDITSHDEVVAEFIDWANITINRYGIPTSDEEFKIFVELVQTEIYNANYDYSVITDEEWKAIAKDILAKAN